MADNTNALNNQLEGLNPNIVGSSSATPKRETGKVAGKEEFLQLLVTQLKNQDPLNPMENQEFAVQLAQFSQLEQLIGINDKISGGLGETSSLAGYLGHQVVLNSSTLSMEDGDGGDLNVDLGSAASNVALELLDAEGNSVGRFDMGPRAAGKQSISVENLPVDDGEYSFRVLAVGASGAETELAAKVAGVVSGFVPGPDPKLLIGNREITLSDIAEVKLAPAQVG